MYQTDAENDYFIVSTASRCLTTAEARYMTTELELLAIVYCVTKFRGYLIGRRFEIVTDHKSWTFLHSTAFHGARLIRWGLLLQQYSYIVTYCCGKDNIVADFLSRYPEVKFIEEKQEPLIISSLQKFCLPVINESELSSLVIMEMHSDDPSLRSIIKNLKNSQTNDEFCKYVAEKIESNDNQIMEKFSIHKKVLFHRNRNNNSWNIVVPSEIKQSIIKITHEKLGHPGVYKTLMYLKKFYYWKGMSKDVKKYVITCDLCQRVKYLSIAMEGPYQLVRSETPSDLVTVDFYGPLPRGRGGVEYIFVVLDAFSKLVRLYPLRRATT